MLTSHNALSKFRGHIYPKLNIWELRLTGTRNVWRIRRITCLISLINKSLNAWWIVQISTTNWCTIWTLILESYECVELSLLFQNLCSSWKFNYFVFLVPFKLNLTNRCNLWCQSFFIEYFIYQPFCNSVFYSLDSHAVEPSRPVAPLVYL